MKMTTGIIIGLCVLIGSIIFISCKNKSNNKPENTTNEVVKKTKVDENHYAKLRAMAMGVTPEQLQLNLNSENEIYGVIMDWNIGSAIVTVVAFNTGDASVYISTGQMLIGGHAHESVINAAKRFIEISNGYLHLAQKTENTQSANGEKVNFYFLTKSGKYYVEDDMSNIENKTSKLLDFFYAGDKVITEYRLIVDK